MEVNAVNCPTCGAPLDKVTPNRQFTCDACGSALVLTDWTADGQIICEDCGTINDDESRFCAGCQTILQAGCTFCGELNPLDAVTCDRCGIDVQRAWTRQRNLMSRREQHINERKQAMKEAQEQSRRLKLQRLLVDLDEPENHPVAIYCLQEFGADAVEPLIALLDSDDPDARYGAAHTLGRLGDRKAIPALIKSLGDREATVRYWAATALGQLRAEEAIAALGVSLKDKSPRVQEVAEESLRQIGTPEAEQALKKKSKSGWWPFG